MTVRKGRREHEPPFFPRLVNRESVPVRTPQVATPSRDCLLPGECVNFPMSAPRNNSDRPQLPLAYVPLISTYNAADLAIIKSVLDNEEIDYQIQGEYFNMAEPLVQPARVFVASGMLERAQEVLKTLTLTILGVSFRET